MFLLVAPIVMQTLSLLLPNSALTSLAPNILNPPFPMRACHHRPARFIPARLIFNAKLSKLSRGPQQSEGTQSVQASTNYPLRDRTKITFLGPDMPAIRQLH